MRTQIVFDVKEGKIIVASGYAKRAQDPRSKEYKTLQKIHHDYPDFEIDVRKIKKNTDKETYKGLTYGYMFNYISIHGTEEDAKELEDMILISECHRQGFRYPTIKNWFLEKYPDVKTFWIENKKAREPEANTTINPNIFAAEANKDNAA